MHTWNKVVTVSSSAGGCGERLCSAGGHSQGIVPGGSGAAG